MTGVSNSVRSRGYMRHNLIPIRTYRVDLGGVQIRYEEGEYE